MSSTIGDLYKITTFGESHGKYIGCVIEGCPSGIIIKKKIIQKELNLRKPGKNKYVSLRKEKDKVILTSGIFKNRTTGTPISVIVKNKEKRSVDYFNISDKFRPGHADLTYQKKYNIRDYRGGGRSSARTTISIVIAGAIAKHILKEMFNIKIFGYVYSVGKKNIPFYKKSHIKKNIFFLPNLELVREIKSYIKKLIKSNDSIGGVINVNISNMPFCLGEPVFDKIESKTSYILSGLNAIKAIEFGSGIYSSVLNGSKNNDKLTSKGFIGNNSGGILGGISSGQDLNIKLHIKPTSSIFKKQKTISEYNSNKEIKIRGRHDPCVALRAVPIIESAVAITILDLVMRHKSKSFF